MHDTRRTQTDTRCHKVNNHSNFQLTANRINYTETNNHTSFQPENNQIMDNNNNRNQNSERCPRVEGGRLKYNCGADDTIMRIIKRKDKSPETRNPRFSGTTHRTDKTRKHAPPLQ